MEMPQAVMTSYAKAKDRAQSHPIRMSEVPVEYSVTMLLPTASRGRPAYIQAASPALRRFGEPVKQGAVDRWWLLDARGARLVQYALTELVPLGANPAFGACEYVSPAPTMEALREGQASLAEAMEGASEAFLNGRPAAEGQGAKVLGLLAKTTAAPLIALYRALAPDFFAWLEA
jgi:hypothetical protein